MAILVVKIFIPDFIIVFLMIHCFDIMMPCWKSKNTVSYYLYVIIIS